MLQLTVIFDWPGGVYNYVEDSHTWKSTLQKPVSLPHAIPVHILIPLWTSKCEAFHLNSRSEFYLWFALEDRDYKNVYVTWLNSWRKSEIGERKLCEIEVFPTGSRRWS